MGFTRGYSDKLRRPGNWVSANQLRLSQRVGSQHLHQLLSDLESSLIADLMAAGYSQNEAGELVGDYFVARGEGKVKLAASPDAIRLLNLTPKGDGPDPMPVGWRGTNELADDYRGGSRGVLIKFEHLEKSLTEDIATAWKCPLQVASSLVDAHLLGRRRPRGGSGPPTLAVSPEIIRLAEADGIITRKRPEAGRRGDVERS